MACGRHCAVADSSGFAMPFVLLLLVALHGDPAPATRPVGASALLAEADALLGGPAPASRPADSYLARRDVETRRLSDLIARINACLASAPSGAEREPLLMRKLAATYALSALQGQPLDNLQRLAADVLRDKPGPALAAAAEYWQLRIESDGGLASPAAPASRLSRVRRIEAFVERHPTHDAVPSLIAELLDWAAADNDYATVDRWLPRLQTAGSSAPGGSTPAAGAEILVGQDRLRRAIGATWTPVLAGASGQAVDWSALRGRPVLAIFWASWDASSTSLLSRVAGWSDMHDAARPRCVLISLDRRRQDAEAGAARWPITAISCCDGRAWASPIVREWGVKGLPLVLVIDDQGRLQAVFDGISEDMFSRLEAAWCAAGGAAEPVEPPPTSR